MELSGQGILGLTLQASKVDFPTLQPHSNSCLETAPNTAKSAEPYTMLNYP